MLINLFVVGQLGDGWNVNSAPIVTADWTVDSGDGWVVPVGAGGGKVVMAGEKLPMNLQTQLYYNVVRPDFGSECSGDYKLNSFFLQVSLKNKTHFR